MRLILQELWLLLIFSLISGCSQEIIKTNNRPQNFVDIQQEIPGITVDMRYATPFNFIGEPIDGYEKPKCLLASEAAKALKQVQIELKKSKFALKIYDCFRPQRAVNQFVRWARDLDDTRMKNTYYPRVDKKDLFQQGYIAAKSGHSRGSTVDLTIIPNITRQQKSYTCDPQCTDNSLPMGTIFDFFDPLSHTSNSQVIGKAKKNRLMLKAVMEKFGFKNLPEEWWHYTLKTEPYPETYFDFPIE